MCSRLQYTNFITDVAKVSIIKSTVIFNFLRCLKNFEQSYLIIKNSLKYINGTIVIAAKSSIGIHFNPNFNGIFLTKNWRPDFSEKKSIFNCGVSLLFSDSDFSSLTGGIGTIFTINLHIFDQVIFNLYILLTFISLITWA